MSGLSGIFYFGAQPVMRGGDTAESPDGSIGTCDGRLDNPEAIRSGSRAHSAALVLERYLRKGTDGFAAVIGDWSLAIYDAGRRAIVLASDFAGVRPLYYFRGRDFVCWSSSLAEVVKCSGASAIDDTYVARFLLHGSVRERTPYDGVRSVPPGHAVCVSAAGTETRAFWELPVGREIRFLDEHTYEERLLQLFREAIAVRTNVASPNCAELSGGLDSSSVVCMADRLRKEADSARGLHTFSYTHERCPDEKYFREVERHCGIAGFHLPLDQIPPVTAGLAGGATPGWWEPRFRELARRMDELGSRVLLTGQLGDLVMGNTTDDSDQVAGLLSHRRYVAALCEAYRWARVLQTPIYPILGRNLRAAWSNWTPGYPDRNNSKTANSLTRALLDRAAEGEEGAAAPWREANPARRRRLHALYHLLQNRALQTPEPLLHTWFTHPFAHRPLVEFMMSIPPAVVCRPGEPRRLMRRAFAGLVPEKVLRRKSKAAYTDAYVGALRPLAAAMLRTPGEAQVVQRGYVEPESLAWRLQKFTQDLECNEQQLRAVILFEYWLRSLSASKAAPDEVEFPCLEHSRK